MNAPTPDERGGWTSASSAEADSLCPGRHLAQRGIPEGEKSAAADSGTRIHAWLEGNWTPGHAPELTDDERETAQKCREIETALVKAVFGEEQPSAAREQRLWIEFDGGIQHSGKADVVYLCKGNALVLDYKTGRNEVTESPRNLQMRDLAVLVATDYKIKRVHVAIIQPWATMQPEVCAYAPQDLVFALTEMESRVLASNRPAAPRIPGEKQCQYCRARATCPEFLAQSLPGELTVAQTEIGVVAGVRGLDSDRLGKFLALVRLAEETATEEVRRRLEAGQAVDGWTLEPGRETEKITDAQTVFNRCLAAGITQEVFVRDCITVGKTAIKTALKTATGAKGKELDGRLDELLAGTTETKTSNPVLKKNVAR